MINALATILGYKLGIGKANLLDVRNEASIAHARRLSSGAKSTSAMMDGLESAAMDVGVGDDKFMGKVNDVLAARAPSGVLSSLDALVRWRYVAFAAALAAPLFAVLGMDSCMQLCAGVSQNRFDAGSQYASLAILALAVMARFGNFKKFLAMCAVLAGSAWYVFGHGSQNAQEMFPGVAIIVVGLYLAVSGMALLISLLRGDKAVSVGLAQLDSAQCASKVEQGSSSYVELTAARSHRTRWNIMFVALLLASYFAPQLYLSPAAAWARPVACVVAKPILGMRTVDFYHRDDHVCDAGGPRPRASSD